MDVDPRLAKELSEALTVLESIDGVLGPEVVPVQVIAAKLYQVGWRQHHFKSKDVLPDAPDAMRASLVQHLHDMEVHGTSAQAVLTNWRAFVRRVERIGDFRCPGSGSSAPH